VHILRSGELGSEWELCVDDECEDEDDEENEVLDEAGTLPLGALFRSRRHISESLARNSHRK
jgi:hypothetical protein